MPLPIQWPFMAESLTRSLGLKGRVSLSIDENVVPIANVAELERSPWNRFYEPGFRALSQAAAGAGRNSFLALRAPENAITIIRSIQIRNYSGAADTLRLQIFTEAQYAAATITSQNVFASQNPHGTRLAALKDLASTLDAGHTAGTPGRTIERHYLANNSQVRVDIPWGLAVYGDNPNGGAIVLITETANLEVRGTFWIEEYRANT